MNWKSILLIVVFLFLIATQFFVDTSNVSSYKSVESFEKSARVDGQLSFILKNNCYDCHSNHTNYPWYSTIGVVNLFLSHHIEEGQEHLNFSDWENYSAKKRLHKLEEVYEEVEEKEMPLKLYTFLHGGLSDADKKIILDWANRK